MSAKGATVDEHHYWCPCNATSHTCTNLLACRWCNCERLFAIESEQSREQL